MSNQIIKQRIEQIKIITRVLDSINYDLSKINGEHTDIMFCNSIHKQLKRGINKIEKLEGVNNE